MDENTFLEHHGVKGMKWGVRRYQNSDGSLTAAGRRKKQRTDEKEGYKRYEQFMRDYHSGKVKKASGNFSSGVDQYRATVAKYKNVKIDEAMHDAYQTRMAKRALASTLAVWGGISVSMLMYDRKK